VNTYTEVYTPMFYTLHTNQVAGLELGLGLSYDQLLHSDCKVVWTTGSTLKHELYIITL